MKVKLLKKIRKRWSIEYFPDGFYDYEGDYVSGPIVVLRKRNVLGLVCFEKWTRVSGPPTRVAQTQHTVDEFKEIMMRRVKSDYRDLPTAKRKIKAKENGNYMKVWY